MWCPKYRPSRRTLRIKKRFEANPEIPPVPIEAQQAFDPPDSRWSLDLEPLSGFAK